MTTTTTSPSYRPPWWYRGRHLQTLWGPLLRRRRRPALRRERVETPDGDFIDLDWLPGRERGAPLVTILHGLEGSARSHYATGLLRDLEKLGWREPQLRVGLIGVSLGGNVMLKWLGERGEQAPPQVVAAVAISTPFNLAARASLLDRGLNRRLYTANFLSTMKAKLDKKAHLYQGVLNLPAALKAKTFAEYDRLVTAPLNGFTSEHDYSSPSSSAQFLPQIRRPALLINALNDPFMPASALPRAAVTKSQW